jgi:hypothetical protein
LKYCRNIGYRMLLLRGCDMSGTTVNLKHAICIAVTSFETTLIGGFPILSHAKS